MSTVSLRNLSKRFGEVKVIENINLEVKDGEFVSFLGPSGCGKTTTLRLIAGFDRATEGEIYFGDRVITSVKQNIFLPPEARNIGMVFQNYAVWPHMNVFANVAYPLRIKKLPAREIKERVNSCLALVKLDQLAGRYPHQLSGGQQQRVALARALVMEPDVMLLDEPLSNLDAKLREDMRFEIKYLQKKLGFTIIYVTHDQAEAMAMSDRIMLLYDNKIQQLDSPRHMYEKPGNKFVADFIGLINFLEAEIVDVKQDQQDGRLGLVRFSGIDDQTELWVRLGEIAPGKVIFAARPENVKLSPETGGKVSGKIAKKVYLGNIIDYRVRLGDVEIRVELPSTMEFEIDQPVGLSFEQEIIFTL